MLSCWVVRTTDEASPAAAIRRPHRAGPDAPQHLPQHEQVLVLCTGDAERTLYYDSPSYSSPSFLTPLQILYSHTHSLTHSLTGTSLCFVFGTVHAVQRGCGLDSFTSTNGQDSGEPKTFPVHSLFRLPNHAIHYLRKPLTRSSLVRYDYNFI